MKIKETIYTETYDDRGRLIKRVRTEHFTDLGPDPDYYARDERVGYSGCHKASSKSIEEAIADYLMSNQW